VARLEVRFKLEAFADVDQAFYYYADKADNRIAASFMRKIDEALERISDYPESCPIHFRQLRRLLVDRFPYWIYYEVHADFVEVHSVLHTKRDSSQMDW